MLKTNLWDYLELFKQYHCAKVYKYNKQFKDNIVKYKLGSSRIYVYEFEKVRI